MSPQEKRPRRRRGADAGGEPAPEADAGASVEPEAAATSGEQPGAAEGSRADAEEVGAREAVADEDEQAGGRAPDGEAGPGQETARPGRRRRGAPETTAPRQRPAARARQRRGDGQAPITVRAQAKYVRTAPRKARLVIDHIRGKSVDEARAILTYTPRGAAKDVLKLLDSCVANAENNHELLADELKIDRAYVDEGPALKRYRPRALGRASRIRKRTSHLTITLTTKE
jgi:ribosomal protein L22